MSAPQSGRDPALSTPVLEAVRRLDEAGRTRMPCPPVRDLIGDSEPDRGYAVQEVWARNRRAAGAAVTGRKVGLTAPAVQRQLGVNQPDFGVLLDDMDVSGMDEVPFGRLLQPKIEAEIAFGLDQDLDRPDLDRAAVCAAAGWVAPALEIVDSRIADWDIHITDTIADNASSGLYVLGQRQPFTDDVEPREVRMTMDLDGRRVSEGDGSACLGDPLSALLWCARTAQQRGAPLRAGEVILSGALGPMVPVGPSARVTAELTSLGRVRARFSTKEQP